MSKAEVPGSGIDCFYMVRKCLGFWMVFLENRWLKCNNKKYILMKILILPNSIYVIDLVSIRLC